MSEVVKDLEREYIRCFIDKEHEMNVDDAKIFLEFNKNNEHAPYREKRIKDIQTYLNRIVKAEENRIKVKEEWLVLALEDKAIKKKWESHGAYFKSNTSYCKWFYKDEEFYMWWSRVDVRDEIHRVRDADLKFMELVELQ